MVSGPGRPETAASRDRAATGHLLPGGVGCTRTRRKWVLRFRDARETRGLCCLSDGRPRSAGSRGSCRADGGKQPTRQAWFWGWSPGRRRSPIPGVPGAGLAQGSPQTGTLHPGTPESWQRLLRPQPRPLDPQAVSRGRRVYVSQPHPHPRGTRQAFHGLWGSSKNRYPEGWLTCTPLADPSFAQARPAAPRPCPNSSWIIPRPWVEAGRPGV